MWLSCCVLCPRLRSWLWLEGIQDRGHEALLGLMLLSCHHCSQGPRVELAHSPVALGRFNFDLFFFNPAVRASCRPGKQSATQLHHSPSVTFGVGPSHGP